MAGTVRDVMTPHPTVLDASSPIREAAVCMRDQGVGSVIVSEGSDLCGIVTDRDIAIRAVADGKDADSTTLQDICSHELVTARPDDKIDDVVKMMRERSVRRVPVVDGGRPVGIVSIGDLAVDRDPKSALASISSAPPNR